MIHEQVRQLLAGMGEARQTLLFSATLPGALAEFARVGLKDPALVRLDTETRISPDLRLAFFTLRLEICPHCDSDPFCGNLLPAVVLSVDAAQSCYCQ